MTQQRVVVVSGLSGAGKASILRALEDLGYEAVDNPPLTLVEDLVGRSAGPLAIGMDARSRGFDGAEVLALLARLKSRPELRPELIYAWADETVLLRRYTETRRRHPLSPGGRVLDGIGQEAVLTQALRDGADVFLDTSDLPLATLRQRIEQRYGSGAAEAGEQPAISIVVTSFAFPAGLPREADMVFDARFLHNPHYDPILRPRTGTDPEVAAYVEGDPDFGRFFQQMTGLLDVVLPRFVQEGKKYATIAVGCTGGRHRSVLLVERLAAYLQQQERPGPGRKGWQVTKIHRELARHGVATSGLAPEPAAGRA